MFNRHAQKSVVATMNYHTVPVPTVKIVPSPSRDHLAVCEAIGAKHITALARMEMVLAIEVGKLYSLQEVNLFLLSLCPAGKEVQWLPLCGRTIKERRRWTYWTNNESNEVFVCIMPAPKYARPVPMKALSLIQTIEKEVPDTFGYYVSDYGDPAPDPFLLVRNEDTNSERIVLHWDEPKWEE